MKNSTFFSVYNKIEKEVPFDAEWKNGTGYLDGAVHEDLGIAHGECAKTVDDYGRQVIIISSPWGNVVIFMRHSGAEEKEPSANVTVVGNVPRKLSRFFSDTAWSENDFYNVFPCGLLQLNLVKALMAL